MRSDILFMSSLALCSGISAGAQPRPADPAAASTPLEPDIVQCDRSLSDTELKRQFPFLLFQAIRRDACRCIKAAIGKPEDASVASQPALPAIVARCVNGAVPTLSTEAVPKSVTSSVLSAFDPRGSNASSPSKPKIDLTTCQVPEYPFLAVRAEVSGDTRLAFLVDSEGRVRESEIIKPSGVSAEHKLLDATALASFKRCRFTVDSSMGSTQKWVEIEYSWQLK